MLIQDQLSSKEEADVVVVGSGIAGISAAYHLEKAGYDVAVLEEFEVASGATQYSSGILYFGSGTDFQTAVKLWGKEKAKQFFNESKSAIDDMLHIVKKKDFDAGLRSPGTLIVARDEKEKKYLENEAKAMDALGYPGELLSSEQVKEHYAGCDFAAGLHQPFCHQLKPSSFVPLLAKSLSSKIYQNSGMTKITEKQNSSGVIVETTSGSVEANQAVIATNLKPAYGLEKHFFQEGSVLLPSEPLGETLMDFWPSDKILWTPDDRYDLLYSHDGVAFLEVYNMDGIEEKTKRYFPQHVKFQRNKTIGDAWSKTLDWLPIVGTVKKNISVSVAMGDQGIVMGFTSGKNIAKLINGETTNFLEMTKPKRFLK